MAASGHDESRSPAPVAVRILFLPAQPGDHPSTTSRVLAYIPLLEARGWRCTVHEPTAAAFRGLERGGPFARAAYYTMWLGRRLADILTAHRYDVVFVQRDLFPFSAGLLERALLARHSAVVYDTDDALHVPQPGHSTSIFQSLRPLAKYDDFARRVAAVLVASEELASHARTLNPECEIFPMTIDIARFRRAREQRGAGGQVVVGWSGSRASLRYLEQLRRPLAAAVEAGARVRIITGAPEAVPDLGVAVEVVPWTAEREAADLVALDIGLLPLADDAFERGKFPYKAVQYGAAGIPVVASNVGHTKELVRDGVTGFIVGSTAEWIERLSQLIVDAGLRRSLGEAAARYAAAEYSAEAHADRLDRVLRRSAA